MIYFHMDYYYPARGLQKFLCQLYCFRYTTFHAMPFPPPALVFRAKTISRVTVNSEFYGQRLSSKARLIWLKLTYPLILSQMEFIKIMFCTRRNHEKKINV